MLLSEIFEGESTTLVVGLRAIATIFFSYRAHILTRWNVFDVMSAADSSIRQRSCFTERYRGPGWPVVFVFLFLC